MCYWVTARVVSLTIRKFKGLEVQMVIMECHLVLPTKNLPRVSSYMYVCISTSLLQHVVAKDGNRGASLTLESRIYHA